MGRRRGRDSGQRRFSVGLTPLDLRCWREGGTPSRHAPCSARSRAPVERVRMLPVARVSPRGAGATALVGLRRSRRQLGVPPLSQAVSPELRRACLEVPPGNLPPYWQRLPSGSAALGRTPHGPPALAPPSGAPCQALLVECSIEHSCEKNARQMQPVREPGLTPAWCRATGRSHELA